MRVHAFIQAAGRSSRMGTPKAFLKLEGRTFLEHLCALYASLGVQVTAIVHPSCLGEALKLELGAAELCVNPNTDGGPLSSLLTGLDCTASAPLTAALPHPVDHPLVRRNTIELLLDAHRTTPDGIIVPHFERTPGHPTLFPSCFFAELRRAPSDRGARSVIEQHPESIQRLEVEDPGVVRNIDTPELYRTWIPRED